MSKQATLSDLFTEKIYRVPDYQRGYSWEKDQLDDLWEDLESLSESRYHYTGVLTLVKKEPEANDIDYWLEKNCKSYYVVDGQQRLTTLVLLIQAFITTIQNHTENVGVEKNSIVFADREIKKYAEKYLYQEKAGGDRTRSYFFSYNRRNPNNEFLRSHIFGESGLPSTIEANYYTRNLSYALEYFMIKLAKLSIKDLQLLFDKVTHQLIFSEYEIENEDDVYVAFETINNRGKKLSNLELLKNRLMFLSTLLRNDGSSLGEYDQRRIDINNAWHEVYQQLGRNKDLRLDDDDFLKSHWITRFQYTRKKGDDYRTFLLNTKFTPKRALNLHDVEHTDSEDYKTSEPENDNESNDETEHIEETRYDVIEEPISYQEIKEYVLSLHDFAQPWFYTYKPQFDEQMDDDERNWIKILNYIGMEYFRPLIAIMLKKKSSTDLSLRISVYQAIERFIFIAFRLCRSNKNYLDNEFFKITRLFELGKKDSDGKVVDLMSIKLRLQIETENFVPNGILKHEQFANYINRLFQLGNSEGFYNWHGLRYFLLQYELKHPSKGKRGNIIPDIDQLYQNMLRNRKDMVSIEHIYPQKPDNSYWIKKFESIPDSEKKFYQGSLGNLLLLSKAINSSLQNDGFDEKKKPKKDEKTGETLRNGYLDGSYSEREVAEDDEWKPEQIILRGKKLLDFMESNWGFKFSNNGVKYDLLHVSPNISDNYKQERTLEA